MCYLEQATRMDSTPKRRGRVPVDGLPPLGQ